MMYVPAPKQIIHVPLSTERMEFQSHDWTVGVELESQLTLVESLPIATPLSLAYLLL